MIFENKYVAMYTDIVEPKSGSRWFNHELMRTMAKAKAIGDAKSQQKIGCNIGAWRVVCEPDQYPVIKHNGEIAYDYLYTCKLYHNAEQICFVDNSYDGKYSVEVWGDRKLWELYAIRSVIQLFGNGRKIPVQFSFDHMTKQERSECRKFLFSA